jgi:hypothetical protein
MCKPGKIVTLNLTKALKADMGLAGDLLER